MHAELHRSSHRQHLAGATATLITMALLAVVFFRPIQQAVTAPDEDVVAFAAIKPEVVPDDLPIIPLQKIDLPPPVAMVNLPEFENPVDSPALPSVAPVTSPDAPARPSGNEALFGARDGTGRTNGSRSRLVPPVRRVTADMPFDLRTASRSGLVTSLNFCVSDRGRVSDVQLAATSGFDDTDVIAIDWLGRQRFTPGTLDGVRARMCATYDIRWTFSKAASVEAQAAAKAHALAIRRRSRYPRQFVYWPHDRPFPGCDAVDICRMDAR